MFPVPDLISSESDWQQSHTPQLYLHAVDFDLTNWSLITGWSDRHYELIKKGEILDLNFTISQFFVLNQYVTVFFVHKGQLGMYKIWKECVPEKGCFILWRWNEIICRLSQWELSSFFFLPIETKGLSPQTPLHYIWEIIFVVMHMQKMTEINPSRVYSLTFLNQHTWLCCFSHVFFNFCVLIMATYFATRLLLQWIIINLLEC